VSCNTAAELEGEIFSSFLQEETVVMAKSAKAKNLSVFIFLSFNINNQITHNRLVNLLNPNYLLALGQDEIPSKVYKGQKLIKLVSVNTPATTNKIMASVLSTRSAKINPTKTAAITKRITRSKFPMFFFILLCF
jgi:hypothetical protein